MCRLLVVTAKTDEDREFIKEQAKDIVRLCTVGVLGVLPGSVLTIAACEKLLNKIDKTLLPSSFRDNDMCVDIKDKINKKNENKPDIESKDL